MASKSVVFVIGFIIGGLIGLFAFSQGNFSFLKVPGKVSPSGQALPISAGVWRSGVVTGWLAFAEGTLESKSKDGSVFVLKQGQESLAVIVGSETHFRDVRDSSKPFKVISLSQIPIGGYLKGVVGVNKETGAITARDLDYRREPPPK